MSQCVCVHLFSLLLCLSVCASTCFLYSCVSVCLRPLVFFTLVSVCASICFLYSYVSVCVRPLVFFTLVSQCVCVHLFSLLLCLSVSASTCFLYSCVCVCIHLFSLLLCLSVCAFTSSLYFCVCVCFLLFSLVFVCGCVCDHLFSSFLRLYLHLHPRCEYVFSLKLIATCVNSSTSSFSLQCTLLEDKNRLLSLKLEKLEKVSAAHDQVNQSKLLGIYLFLTFSSISIRERSLFMRGGNGCKFENSHFFRIPSKISKFFGGSPHSPPPK